jgi:hypothetical protein
MGLNASRVWLDRELATCVNSRRKNCLAVDAERNRLHAPLRRERLHSDSAWFRRGYRYNVDHPVQPERTADHRTTRWLT